MISKPVLPGTLLKIFICFAIFSLNIKCKDNLSSLLHGKTNAIFHYFTANAYHERGRTL